MAAEDQILEKLMKSTDPMSAGQLAEATGMERKEVDKAMNVLKKAGRITSPRRCYWTVS